MSRIVSREAADLCLPAVPQLALTCAFILRHSDVAARHQ